MDRETVKYLGTQIRPGSHGRPSKISCVEETRREGEEGGGKNRVILYLGSEDPVLGKKTWVLCKWFWSRWMAEDDLQNPVQMQQASAGSSPGAWVLGTGYWVLGTGYWEMDTGARVLGALGPEEGPRQGVRRDVT